VSDFNASDLPHHSSQQLGITVRARYTGNETERRSIALIQFLLNNEQHTIEDVNPNTSVLDYLRDHLDRVGTKEGCASGDCGACTVVLGEVRDGAMSYAAINSCITPVGNLQGKQLITVEDLKSESALHPVQQAMVDCHGSQCGFCTPGFVMSMFAYRKNNAQPERESIIEALGGNLCRCTGYQPIIAAAAQMYEPSGEDQFSGREKDTLIALSAIENSAQTVFLSGSGNQYYSPTSSEQLAELLATHPDAKLVAGGTDLSLEITQFLREINTLIYTGRVEEMLQLVETDSALEIGAAASYSDCKDALCREFPDLHELIERLGSRQIRNQGTLGGNVGNASPIGDMPPVLIALDAKLVLRSTSGTRTIGVEDYFVSYKVTDRKAGEFIETIIIPKAKAGYLFKAYKISKRLEDDISAICGIFYLNIEENMITDASIAFGGMAEIPKRASLCEQALIGHAWSQDTIALGMEALGKDFTPISDFRASSEYRSQVSKNLLQRLFLDSDTQTVRVTQYA
jgi:xanthine dehydrogenase small subunit